MVDSSPISGRQPKAIQNALAVLEAVALSGSGVTAKQIAARLSMPPATVYRILNLLVAEEYIVRLPELSGFALGRRVDVFVDAALTPTIVQSARDLLTELRMTVRVGIHLCSCRSGVVRILDADPDFPPPLSEPELNARLPRTALGELMAGGREQTTAHRVADVAPGTESVVVGIYNRDGVLHAALWMLGSPSGIAVVQERLTTIARRAGDLDPLLH
ncbi:IclR family transcriptional regulator [Nocardioides aromaticivorans]|uniref:IclR family transcriptional regulator n=1 Tax=Nocardioides aromaticivorans TaxID=200618 RepID=A0ABX7PR28_9ACTN|nr:helix-turn-helix domain-containing protein [Nocardioides aromaticivorans]QSR28269.1 IclR family transcriptional regulator [Nocardioides aromaticivorans]